MCDREGCKNMRDNFTKLASQAANISWDKQRCEKAEKDLQAMKTQMVETTALIEEKSRQIYELGNKERTAKAEAEQARRSEEEMERQLRFAEERYSDVKKKADAVDIYRSRCVKLAEFCEELQNRRVKLADTLKETVTALKESKKENGELKSTVDTLKTEKTEAMNRLKLYKKHLPNLFKLLDELIPQANDINYHMKKRMNTFVDPEMRRQLLHGIPSATMSNGNHDDTSDEELDDIAALISGAPAVDPSPVPRFKVPARKTPIKAKEAPKEVEKEKAPAVPVIDLQPSTSRRQPAVFEPKGRQTFGRQKHNVEAIEKAMAAKIQQKLTRNDEENEKRSEVAGGHSTIHGKKGPTVREQQSGMMSVKEKVALMREEENKKGQKKQAPESVDQPSTSKASDPFSAFEPAVSSPRPERQRTLSEISQSSDRFGLRMTPSPSASPVKSTPSGSLQSLADDAVERQLEDMDYNVPYYEPVIENPMPSAPSMPHLDAIEVSPMVKEPQAVPLPAESSIVPAPSMPHLKEIVPVEERPQELTGQKVPQKDGQPAPKLSTKKVQFQLDEGNTVPSEPENTVVAKLAENPLAEKVIVPEAPKKPVEPVKKIEKTHEQTPSKEFPAKEPDFSPKTNKALRNMSKISAELTTQITPIKSRPERPQAPKARKLADVAAPSTSMKPMEIEAEEDVPVAEPVVTKRKAHVPKEVAPAKPLPRMIEKAPEPEKPVVFQEKGPEPAETLETAPIIQEQEPVKEKEPSPTKRVTRRSQSIISEKGATAPSASIPATVPVEPVQKEKEAEQPALPKRRTSTRKESAPIINPEPIISKRITRSSKVETPVAIESGAVKLLETGPEPTANQETAVLETGALEIATEEEEEAPVAAEVKNLVETVNSLAASASAGPLQIVEPESIAKAAVSTRRTRMSVKSVPTKVEKAPESREEASSSEETESSGELQIDIEGASSARSEDSPKTAISKLMARISKNVGDKPKFSRSQTVPREKKTPAPETIRKTSEPATTPGIPEPVSIIERRVTRATRNAVARYTPENPPKESKVAKSQSIEQAKSSVHKDLEMTSDEEEEVISPRKKKHVISSDEEEEPIQKGNEATEDLPFAEKQLQIVEEEKAPEEKRQEEEKPVLADLFDLPKRPPPSIFLPPPGRPGPIANFRPAIRNPKTSLMFQVQQASQAMARRLQAAGNRRLPPGREEQIPPIPPVRVVQLVRKEGEEPVAGPSGLQKEPEVKKIAAKASGKTKKIEIVEPKVTARSTRGRGRNPPAAPVIFKPVKAPVKRKAEPEIFSLKKMKTHSTSAESILIKALDLGCNEQEILKKMAREDLDQIATIGAERFAEIMMEYVIRMNRVEMWHSVVAMHRTNIPGPITNSLEENLLQISYNFCGENVDVITPFIRKCLSKIFTKMPIDELLCHKIIRLIMMGYAAQMQISSSQNVQERILKESKALVKFMCFYRPNLLGKSLIYMVNRMPLEFLAEEEFEEARHLMVLYSEDVLDIFNFFWDNTMKKVKRNTVIVFPTKAQIDQWIADKLSVDKSGDDEKIHALRSVFLTTARTFPIVLKEINSLTEVLDKIAEDYRIGNKEDDIVGSLFGSTSSSSLHDPGSATVAQMLFQISGLVNLLEPITRGSTLGQDRQKAFFFGLSKTIEKVHEILEFLSSHIGKGAPTHRVRLHGGLQSFFRRCQGITRHQL